MSGVAPTTPPELLGTGRSRVIGRMQAGSIPIAVASTVIVFGAIGYILTTSPGWPVVQRTFFSVDHFVSSAPDIVAALWKNVQLFVLAEALILVLALVLAVLRSLPGPVFFPLRLFSVAYIDLFRGVPSVLVIYLLGFGIPALDLPGVTNDIFIWGLVSLVLVWSAYVAEVYRAGI